MLDFYNNQVDALGAMVEAISKNPIGIDMRVVRGVNYDALKTYGIKSGDDAQTILSKLQAEGTFIDKGFMSVCPSLQETELPDILKSKPIRLVIDLDKSTKGLDMSEISMIASEKELLLQNGLAFKPVSAQEKDGKIFIYMIQSLNK